MGNKIDWLKERKTYLGGSDIAAILGESRETTKILGLTPFRTGVDVYLEKISEEIRNFEDTPITRRGHLAEELIAREYVATLNVKVRRQKELIRHREYPFLAVNIDRWVGDKEYILECKTVNSFADKKWGDEYTDQIPKEYLCQVAYYSAITGVPKVDIACLSGGVNFRIYTYKKNEELEEKLIRKARDFWINHIEARIPPEPVRYEDTLSLYPQSNGLEITADEHITEQIAELKRLMKVINESEEEILKIKLSVQNLMRDNEVLLDKEGKTLVTWKNSPARTVLDTEKFKKEHEELFKQYAKKANAGRRFIVK